VLLGPFHSGNVGGLVAFGLATVELLVADATVLEQCQLPLSRENNHFGSLLDHSLKQHDGVWLTLAAAWLLDLSRGFRLESDFQLAVDVEVLLELLRLDVDLKFVSNLSAEVILATVGYELLQVAEVCSALLEVAVPHRGVLLVDLRSLFVGHDWAHHLVRNIF